MVGPVGGDDACLYYSLPLVRRVCLGTCCYHVSQIIGSSDGIHTGEHIPFLLGRFHSLPSRNQVGHSRRMVPGILDTEVVLVVIRENPVAGQCVIGTISSGMQVPMLFQAIQV